MITAANDSGLQRTIFERPVHKPTGLPGGLRGQFYRMAAADRRISELVSDAHDALDAQTAFANRPRRAFESARGPVVQIADVIRERDALKDKIIVSDKTATGIRNNLYEHAKTRLDSMLFFWRNAERFRFVMNRIRPEIFDAHGVDAMDFTKRDFLRHEMRGLFAVVTNTIDSIDPLMPKAKPAPDGFIKDTGTYYLGQPFDRAYVDSRLKAADISIDDILDAPESKSARSPFHVFDRAPQSATILPFRLGR